VSGAATSGAGLILRLAFLALAIVGAVVLSNWISDAVSLRLMPENEAMIHKIIMLALLSYVVTMSLPFLPGAEIGLALLTTFGQSIAPAVYLATVLALSIAFAIGRFVPCHITASWLAAVGLKRGAAMVRQLGEEPPENAAALILGRSQNWLVRGLVKHRYIALALLINLPGNILIGGGGGIALAAGLSRTFHPLLYLATIMIAVMPVPLAFLIGGG
jgi:hypothetical protein